MKLDSGCAMTTFPRAHGSGKGGNGREYKTASGEFIKDEGGVSATARDEHNEVRKITGRIADIHKPLESPSQCAKAGQLTYLDDSGGWMFSKDSAAEASFQDPRSGIKETAARHGAYLRGKGSLQLLKLGQSGSIAPLE